VPSFPDELTILSWNINHRTSSLAQLSNFGSDIALLQEAPKLLRPEESTRIVAPPTDNWRIRHYGSHATAIAVMNPAVNFSSYEPVDFGLGGPMKIESSHLGQFSVIWIPWGRKGLFLVSLYGIIEHDFADSSLHRALSDLTPIFEQGPDVLVGADLNAFRGYSISGKEQAVRRHQFLFDRFEMLGLACIGPFSSTGPLENCPCHLREACDHVQTYRHMNQDSSRSFQNDYVFATKRLRRQLVSCKALATENRSLWEFSDHSPIEIKLRNVEI